jgi:hypothetical protein
VAAGAVTTRLVPVLAVPEVASDWGGRVRRRRRGGSPEAFPAATVWFWLQEVHQAHGQLDVRAFVPVNRVGPPALEQAVHEVAHAASVLAGEEIAREDELGVPAVVCGRQLPVQGLQIPKEFFAGLNRRFVVPTDVGAVGNIITAWLEEIPRQDRKDEDAAVPAGHNHSVELSQGGREEGVGGHHQVADHVILLVFLQGVKETRSPFLFMVLKQELSRQYKMTGMDSGSLPRFSVRMGRRASTAVLLIVQPLESMLSTVLPMSEKASWSLPALLPPMITASVRGIALQGPFATEPPSSLRERGLGSKSHLNTLPSSVRRELIRICSFLAHIFGRELPSPATGWHMSTKLCYAQSQWAHYNTV